MNVKAKFTCTQKIQKPHGFEIHMSAVCGGDEENDRFFKYTPYGELSLGTINEAAAEQFVPGKDYYLVFAPAN